MAPPPKSTLAPPTPMQFRAIGDFLHERFGIEVRPGKSELIAGRLLRAAGSVGCNSIGEYLALLRSARGARASSALVAELTTNFTLFFREADHFRILRDRVLAPTAPGQQLLLWSAACSSGEEAYSMAIAALEQIGTRARADVRILASDISMKVLAQGARGAYPERAIESLEDNWRQRYFLRGEGQWRGWCRVKPEIRKMVEFRRINLLQPGSGLPRFHAIFCRNVMIYFDAAARNRVFRDLARRLEPGGVLAVAHAECAGLSAPGLVPAGQGCWILKETPA